MRRSEWVARSKPDKSAASFRSEVSCRFMRLFGDLEPEERNVALECGLGKAGVYVYDTASRSTRAPKPNDLPWPAEFVLRAYNRKHIFVRRARPSLAGVSNAIEQWKRRVQWRIALEGEPSILGGASARST